MTEKIRTNGTVGDERSALHCVSLCSTETSRTASLSYVNVADYNSIFLFPCSNSHQRCSNLFIKNDKHNMPQVKTRTW